MYKTLILLVCAILLTSCSMPDVDCEYCGKKIYSGDSKEIDTNYCCDDCYFEANTCEHCGKKYINRFVEKRYCVCDGCVDNGYVVYCYLCDKYKDAEEVAIEPYINGSYSINNICYDCLNK